MWGCKTYRQQILQYRWWGRKEEQVERRWRRGWRGGKNPPARQQRLEGRWGLMVQRAWLRPRRDCACVCFSPVGLAWGLSQWLPVASSALPPFQILGPSDNPLSILHPLLTDPLQTHSGQESQPGLGGCCHYSDGVCYQWVPRAAGLHDSDHYQTLSPGCWHHALHTEKK